MKTFSLRIIVAVAVFPLSKLLLPFSGEKLGPPRNLETINKISPGVGGEDGVEGVEASVLFLGKYFQEKSF